MADEPGGFCCFLNLFCAANRESVATSPGNLCDVPVIAEMKVIQNTLIIRFANISLFAISFLISRNSVFFNLMIVTCHKVNCRIQEKRYVRHMIIPNVTVLLT